MEQYEKQVFEDGQVLSASHMNHIEEGLESVSDNLAGVDGSSAIICSAMGETVTVNDSAERMLRGLTVYGKTTQDGTPTPENPVELVSVGSSGSIGVSVCGKNLFNPDDLSLNNNTSMDISDDGYTITLTGGTVAYAYSAIDYDPAMFAGRTVYLQADNISGELAQIIYKTSGGTPTYCPIVPSVLNRKIEVPEDITLFHLAMYTNNSSTALDADKIVTFKGLRITLVEGASWEAYKEIQSLTAQTTNGLPGIPVSSGGNYTDTDGQQWICDEIDFARGVYVQRVYTEKMEESAIKSVNNEYVSVAGCTAYISTKMPVMPALETVCVISDIATGVSFNSRGINVDTYRIYGPEGAVSNVWFRCTVNAGEKTLEEIKEITVGSTLIYVLATPTETDLTAEELAEYAALHTNKPNTTVHNDGGAGMKLEYVADTKTYIDNKFAALSAALLNN